MKKLFIFLLAVLFSSVVFAVISGSAHDFSAEGWSGGRICIVCHTPHHADITVTDSPLWNHELTTTVYTLYNSARLDATLSQPDGISKLCLSCHDGTVALDSFGGDTGTNFLTGSAQIGQGANLNSHHPISFTYDAALATLDGNLYDPTTQNSGLGGTINTDLLYNNRMECSSCHDVHNRYSLTYLLKISNAASLLCLTCHNI